MIHKEALTLRSSIHAPLMRFTLLRGTAMAGVGALLLILGGSFLSADILKIWGLPIFLGGIGMITWGLLPYSRLKKLETSPYLLTSSGPDWLVFSAKNRPLLSIPVSAIHRCSYLEKGRMYGIGIWYKKPLPEKIIVHTTLVNMTDYQKHALRCYGCDLFFPYFSSRSYQNLEAYLQE